MSEYEKYVSMQDEHDEILQTMEDCICSISRSKHNNKFFYLAAIGPRSENSSTGQDFATDKVHKLFFDILQKEQSYLLHQMKLTLAANLEKQRKLAEKEAKQILKIVNTEQER